MCAFPQDTSKGKIKVRRLNEADTLTGKGDFRITSAVVSTFPFFAYKEDSTIKVRTEMEFFISVNYATPAKWKNIYKDKSSGLKTGDNKIYPSKNPEPIRFADSTITMDQYLGRNMQNYSAYKWYYKPDTVMLKIQVDKRGVAGYDYIKPGWHSDREQYCYARMNEIKKWSPALFEKEAADVNGILTIIFYKEKSNRKK